MNQEAPQGYDNQYADMQGQLIPVAEQTTVFPEFNWRYEMPEMCIPEMPRFDLSALNLPDTHSVMCIEGGNTRKTRIYEIPITPIHGLDLQQRHSAHTWRPSDTVGAGVEDRNTGKHDRNHHHLVTMIPVQHRLPVRDIRNTWKQTRRKSGIQMTYGEEYHYAWPTWKTL
jgi:hypothetical protein